MKARLLVALASGAAALALLPLGTPARVLLVASGALAAWGLRRRDARLGAAGLGAGALVVALGAASASAAALLGGALLALAAWLALAEMLGVQAPEPRVAVVALALAAILVAALALLLPAPALQGPSAHLALTFFLVAVGTLLLALFGLPPGRRKPDKGDRA